MEKLRLREINLIVQRMGYMDVRTKIPSLSDSKHPYLLSLHHLYHFVTCMNSVWGCHALRIVFPEENGTSPNSFNINFKTSIFQNEWSYRIRRENQSYIAVENSALWQSMGTFRYCLVLFLQRGRQRHFQIENWDIIWCFGND